MYVKKTILKRVEDLAAMASLKGMRRCGEDTVFFTGTELEYCSGRLRCLGAKLLIKECVFAYLESEVGALARNYREIEILNDELRKPMVRLFSGVRQCADRLHIKNILVSISHSRSWIAGMVVFCY